MTSFHKDNERKFMGIKIEGDYSSGHYYVEQRPMSDLTPFFKDAFDQGVKAISWNQYTPYFNDGDSCDFGVGDFSLTTNPKVAAAWINEDALDEEDDSYYDESGTPIDSVLRTDFYSYEQPWSDSYPHPDGITKGQIKFPNTSEFHQVLDETFGDHTRVVVTPDRVVQFEYEHE